MEVSTPEKTRRRRVPRSGKSLYALAQDLEGKTNAWWNDNPHLSGACECPCHRPIGPDTPPTDGPARTVGVSDRTGRTDPDLP